jgi:hypothetical protein
VVLPDERDGGCVADDALPREIRVIHSIVKHTGLGESRQGVRGESAR